MAVIVFYLFVLRPRTLQSDCDQSDKPNDPVDKIL